MFHGKYRIDTARMKGWNYSGGGCYFVTICTRDRAHFLGKIIGEALVPTLAGKIVAEEWQKTIVVRPYVNLGAWVVMPNHFHAVLNINHSSLPDIPAGMNDPTPQTKSKPNWAVGSLGAIINQFKSTCTKRIWRAGCPDFGWQPRYYDHIICDEIDLRNCSEYILTNPSRWETDELHQEESGR